MCAVHALSGSTLDGVLSRRGVSGTVGQATRTDRLCAVPETRVTASSRRPTGSGTAAPGAGLPPPFPAGAGGHARPVSRFYVRYFTSSALDPCAGSAGAWRSRRLAHVRQARLRRRGGAIFSGILHGATLPAEGRRRRDGLDWWPAKGPRRPPGPGPPRTLPARSSPGLSSAPAQDAVERPATDSTPGLDPRARSRGDPDTFGRCGHLDHLSDHRDASLARLVSPTAGA